MAEMEKHPKFWIDYKKRHQLRDPYGRIILK
jgi:hypothetical protein